jgi:hypothetical protein
MLKRIISASFLLSAGAAWAQVPSLSSLGYAVSNGNHAQPANFANDMRRGIQMTQAEHGCSWAVRPLIYVFSDVVVYANPNAKDYNSFDHGTVRSKGCALPASVNTTPSPANSSQLPKLRDMGWPVDNANHTRPSDFQSVMNKGMRITQQQHQCSWAVRPLIYVFADAVVYANENGNDYNVFDMATVRSKGCVIPGSNPPAPSPSTGSRVTLASLGYRVDNANHKRPESFAVDMAQGIVVTQSEHKCSWAVRPMIVAFPDGVVYANNSGDDYNVFDINTVKSKGCFIPSAPKPTSPADGKPLNDDMMQVVAKYNNNMATYQGFVGSQVEMSMPRLEISEDSRNRVALFIPQDPDELMSAMSGFTTMPSTTDGGGPVAFVPRMSNGRMTEPDASVSAFMPIVVSPLPLPPSGGLGRPTGPVRPIFTIPAPRTISNTHKWVANRDYEAGYRYDYTYTPGIGSLKIAANGAVFGRILSQQADLVSLAAKTERDMNNTPDNVNDDKLGVTVTGKVYTKTYNIYENTVTNIDREVIIEASQQRTTLWNTFFNFSIGPVPFTATIDLFAVAGWERGSYGWGLKNSLLVPKATMDFTPSGRFYLNGKLEPGVTQLNRYLNTLGAVVPRVGAGADLNLIDGQLKLYGYINPNGYCRTVRLQNVSTLNGRIYGYIEGKIPVVRVVNEVIGELCKYDIFGVCKSKAVQTIQRKINELSEFSVERDWYKFPGYRFADYDVNSGCSKF